MQRNFSVSFDHVNPLSTEDIKGFRREFREMGYSDEQGYGFRNIMLDDDYLSATLVKRTPTFIPQFDIKTGQIVEQKIFLFSEIEFALDAKYQLLEVFGSTKDTPKVRAVLRPLLRSEVRLYSTNLAPAEVIPKLTKSSVHISVDKLTVNNFQHREGIIGRYEMKLANSDWAMDMIKKYAHDVIKATILVSSGGFTDFTLDISRLSRMTIKCEEDQFNTVLSYLKSVLFKEELGDYA